MESLENEKGKTMEMTSDLLRKIKALLAKTTANGATENEAMTASEKVRELLDKHNLSLVDISNLNTEPKIEVITKEHRNKELQFPVWKGWISVGVADYYNCKILRAKTGPMWIGTAEDIAVTEEMYDFIINQIELMKSFALSDAQAQGHYRNRGESLIFYKEYKLGAAERIYYRFKELIELRKRTNATESRALVIIDSAKSKAVSEVYNKRVSKRKTSRSVKYKQSKAYYAGHQDANQIAINKQVEK